MTDSMQSLQGAFDDMLAVAVRSGQIDADDLAAVEHLLEEGRQRNLYWEIQRAAAGGKPQVTRGTLPDDYQPMLGPVSTHLHDGTEAWYILPDETRIHDHGEGYRCRTCNDTTFYRRDVPVGHQDFGKVFRCECHTRSPEYQREAAKRRLETSGVSGEMLDRTFESFLKRAGNEQAKQVVMDFVDNLRTGAERPRTLVLYGQTGSGKTHLLVAALQMILLHTDAAGTTFGDLLEACKAEQFARDSALTARAIDVPVLVLDEFGSASSGEWATDKAERILNKRMEANRWTLIGMTALQEEIAGWSKRMADRLASRKHVVEIKLRCESYRVLQKG